MDLKIRLRVLQIVEPKLGHGLAMAHSWLNKITWLSFGSLLAHSTCRYDQRGARGGAQRGGEDPVVTSTPADIIKKVNADTQKIVSDPEFQKTYLERFAVQRYLARLTPRGGDFATQGCQPRNLMNLGSVPN
jgi:hypothetical protein